MKCLALVLALLPAFAGGAEEAPGRVMEEAVARMQAENDAALRKLEDDLRAHLRRRGSRAPMPWREAVLLPDIEQIIWGPRTLRWNKGRATYRVAMDPRTRWFYVMRSDRQGAASYFGPIERGKDGNFVDWGR